MQPVPFTCPGWRCPLQRKGHMCRNRSGSWGWRPAPKSARCNWEWSDGDCVVLGKQHALGAKRLREVRSVRVSAPGRVESLILEIDHKHMPQAARVTPTSCARLPAPAPLAASDGFRLCAARPTGTPRPVVPSTFRVHAHPAFLLTRAATTDRYRLGQALLSRPTSRWHKHSLRPGVLPDPCWLLDCCVLLSGVGNPAAVHDGGDRLGFRAQLGAVGCGASAVRAGVGRVRPDVHEPSSRQSRTSSPWP